MIVVVLGPQVAERILARRTSRSVWADTGLRGGRGSDADLDLRGVRGRSSDLARKSSGMSCGNVDVAPRESQQRVDGRVT